MSREAVLSQWERKIEVAERLEDDTAPVSQPVELHPAAELPRRGRFERRTPEADEDEGPERRTITITGRPTPGHATVTRRRRPVVDAQLAQPDRIALWAFLLGLLLVAVAAGTAHG